MTIKSMKCAIYTRKSSEEGLEQDYNSLDAQRDACRSYIESQKAQGWKVHEGSFDDGGISGGTMERPGLKELLRRVECGDVQVIVVYKIDRLTRSLADFARIVEVLDKHGASFVSVTQQFNTTTSMGRLTLNVLLSFAQFEREVTSERIRDKIAASKRKGLWMGGHPPLGYDILNRRLAINAREAETVTLIFKTALETKSLSRLEARLSAMGIRSKSWRTQKGKQAGGNYLTRSMLGRILRNPVYLGKVKYGGKLYDGEHSPIIEVALWDKVQTMLDSARADRIKALNNHNDTPLRDLVFDDAGVRMVPHYAKKKQNIVYRYYVSAPLVRGDKTNIGSISRVNANLLERLVAEALYSETGGVPVNQRPTIDRKRVKRVIVCKSEIVLIAPNAAGTKEVTHHIEASLEKPTHRRQILNHGGKNNQNENLIKAVAQAHAWRRALEKGQHASVKQLAAEKHLSERYVWKILRLAYLAPSIIEAILEGRQPHTLSLRQINETALSPRWGSQVRLLGFDAAA